MKREKKGAKALALAREITFDTHQKLNDGPFVVNAERRGAS
jgi:hypothetical protein